MQTNWTNDHRKWYREVYLKSEHWRELRGRKLRQNPKCERCLSSACDVHHVNYRNIFDVQLTDLLSLCRPCHEEEHRVNGAPKRTRPNLDVDFQSKVIIDQADKFRKAAAHKLRMNSEKSRIWSKQEKKERMRQKKARDFARRFPMLARKLAPR